MKQRMIKVLAIGFAVAGLSAGLATTALAAAHTADHTASKATQQAAEQAARTAAARSAASSGSVNVARIKAEIQSLTQLEAEGRASTAQVAELHALEAVLAQITSGN
jgi:hypothetical protein